MLPAGDPRMEWTLYLVGMTISRPNGLGDIADLGLTLAEAKLLLVVATTITGHAAVQSPPTRRRLAPIAGVAQYSQ
jgi:hypothetical protein